MSIFIKGYVVFDDSAPRKEIIMVYGAIMINSDLLYFDVTTPETTTFIDFRTYFFKYEISFHYSPLFNYL